MLSVCEELGQRCLLQLWRPGQQRAPHSRTTGPAVPYHRPGRATGYTGTMLPPPAAGNRRATRKKCARRPQQEAPGFSKAHARRLAGPVL